MTFSTGKLVWPLVMLAGLLCAGCSESERHRVLSYFFDGVPPLPGEDVEQTESDDPQDPRRRRVEPTWFLHEPQSNCERCHGSQKQKNFSRQVNLVTPLPTLCYECHDMPHGGMGWVHGPVASGQCVICHEPHRSLHRFLLKRPEPQICLQCHEEASLHEIPGHGQASYQACLDCHAGHNSFAKHLLEVGPVVSNARQGRTEPTGDARFDASVAKAQADIQAGQGLQEALDVAGRHVDALDLLQARAVLLAVRLSLPFTAAERQQIQAMQARIEAAEKTEQAQQKSIRRERAEQMAQLYYNSVNLYRSGRLSEARSGFESLLNSEVVPDPIKQAIRQYVADIDQRLSQGGGRQ